MADEEKLSSIASPIANLVPEIFYDLICRVPPGTALALFVMWMLDMFKMGGVFSVDKFIAIKFAPLVILFSLLIGLGYVIGIILTPIGDLLHRIYWIFNCSKYSSLPDKTKTWVNNTFKELNIPYIFPIVRTAQERRTNQERRAHQEKPTAQETHYRRIDGYLHDFLKTENPQAKQVLAKMRAEAALCHNLAAALIIMILVPSYISYSYSSYWRTTLLLALFVILVLSIWAGYHRQARLIARQLSFLLLVLSEKSRARNPQQEPRNVPTVPGPPDEARV
ncbi:MAG: hypothetical protein HYY96_01390 [Candidatus Tectomicrobia bacterium]|nr:hypothetical protein [Candidatus Tectomicrobia bacterium]